MRETIPENPANTPAPQQPAPQQPAPPFIPRTPRPPEAELHRSLRQNCRFYLLLAALVGVAYPLLFCRAHHSRIADITTALTTKFCQQGFVDPGKRHGGVRVNHARAA